MVRAGLSLPREAWKGKNRMTGSGITRDEWLKALGDLAPKPADPDAVTVREFATMLGIGRQAAEARLRALVAAGKATRTTKMVPRRSDGGGRVAAYAYLLVTKGKAKR